MSDDNTVVTSAETTTQDDLEVNAYDDASTSESEAAPNPEGGQQQSGETPEQRNARIKRTVEREAKKQGLSVEAYLGIGSQESPKESSKVDVDDRYARLELKTEGITSKKAQDIVIEYAEWKGIDVTDALKSPSVKAELAELERKTASPAPSKRTSTGGADSFDHWVAQAKKGNFPLHDPVMMEKLSKARIFTK